MHLPSHEIYARPSYISRDACSGHPDSGLATALDSIIEGLRSWRPGASFHSLDIRDSDTSNFTYSNKHASVVEIIAVSSKASQDDVTNHTQRGALQDSAAEEVSGRIIVSMVTVNNDWKASDVSQRRELYGVEFILTCW